MDQQTEQDARQLLKKSGYRILSQGEKSTLVTIVDGREHYGYLAAEFLVEKNRRQFVVLAHSGEESADPTEPALQRRLIELNRGFPRCGLLLADLNQGEIQRVSFRFPHERNIDFYFQFLLAVFIIAAIIGIIWVLANLRLI